MRGLPEVVDTRSIGCFRGALGRLVAGTGRKMGGICADPPLQPLDKGGPGGVES